MCDLRDVVSVGVWAYYSAVSWKNCTRKNTLQQDCAATADRFTAYPHIEAVAEDSNLNKAAEAIK